MQYTIMDRGIKAFSTKKWDIAKSQLKICNAVGEESELWNGQSIQHLPTRKANKYE